MKVDAVPYFQPSQTQTIERTRALPEVESTLEEKTYRLLTGKVFEEDVEPKMEYLVFEILETVSELCEEKSGDFKDLEFLLLDLEEIAPENQAAVLNAAKEMAKEHPILVDFLSKKQANLADAPFQSSKQLGLPLEETDEPEINWRRLAFIGTAIMASALALAYLFGGAAAAKDSTSTSTPSDPQDPFATFDQKLKRMDAQHKVDQEKYEHDMRLLKDGLTPARVSQIEERQRLAAEAGARLRALNPGVFSTQALKRRPGLPVE